MTHSMARRQWWSLPRLLVCALAWLGGCEHAEVELGQRCPLLHPDCTALTKPEISDAGSTPPTPAAFGIELRDNQGAPTNRVQLDCEGHCIDVLAAPLAGTAPYTLQWEDGSQTPIRHVCNAEPRQLRVFGTDSTTPAMHAEAQIEVVAMSCPAPKMDDADAGPTSTPGTAGAPATPACGPLNFQPLPAELVTASVEGPPRACQGPEGFSFSEGQAPWPLRAGRSYTLQSQTQANWFGRWRMELWGSSGGCALDEKLGELNIAAAASSSAVITPERDHKFLVLHVMVNAGRMFTPMVTYTLCSM